MSVYRILTLVICSTLSSLAYSQEQLSVSGSLDNNTYFYLYDDKIVPPGIPQYERQQIGLETWLSLRAQIAGFDFGMRYDTVSYTHLTLPTSDLV